MSGVKLIVYFFENNYKQNYNLHNNLRTNILLFDQHNSQLRARNEIIPPYIFTKRPSTMNH